MLFACEKNSKMKSLAHNYWSTDCQPTNQVMEVVRSLMNVILSAWPRDRAPFRAKMIVKFKKENKNCSISAAAHYNACNV
jgi:hypothetical protein